MIVWTEYFRMQSSCITQQVNYAVLVEEVRSLGKKLLLNRRLPKACAFLLPNRLMLWFQQACKKNSYVDMSHQCWPIWWMKSHFVLDKYSFHSTSYSMETFWEHGSTTWLWQQCLQKSWKWVQIPYHLCTLAWVFENSSD